jgi:hypothetical protein
MTLDLEALKELAGRATETPAWEHEADRICAAMVKRAPDALRKASEALYEAMLYDVQDYLRENVDFNLSHELARAKERVSRAESASACLAAEVERLREALEPFTDIDTEGCEDMPEETRVVIKIGQRVTDYTTRLIHFRRARAALSPTPPADKEG